MDDRFTDENQHLPKQVKGKTVTPPMAKRCNCGKPSMFGDNTPINHCQPCYINYIHDRRHPDGRPMAQSVSKEEMYAAARRNGLGKTNGETLADYAVRCRNTLGSVTRITAGIVGRNSSRMAGAPQNPDGVETDEPEAFEPDAYLSACAEYAERQA